jgi:hypothetical protein
MIGLGIGYAHAIAYVYVTTHIVPKGIEERYRGTEDSSLSAAMTNPPPDTASIGIGSASDTPTPTSTAALRTAEPKELQFAKSFGEMLNIIHTHIVTMTLIFAISGFITLLTRSLSPKLRNLAVFEPFIGIIVTFAGLWATRYLEAGFSWVVSASGALMAIAFVVQCFAVFLELRAAKRVTTKAAI